MTAPEAEPAEDGPRPLGERERYVAFAFAGADLLVETDLAGRITFAAGAFRMRLGQAPEALMGRPVTELVAPAYRGPLAAALAALPARGRLPPTRLRLADAATTSFTVAGLHLDRAGAPPRLCLSFGPPAGVLAAQPAGLRGPEALLREAEARVRAGHAAGGGAGENLGLIEVAGRLGPGIGSRLQAAIAAEAGADALTAEMAPGRYGLLAAAGGTLPDLAALGQRLEGWLQAHAPGAQLRSEALPLDSAGLTPMQAVRALRHGLSTYAKGGVAALPGAGFGAGLSGFVGQVTKRAGELRRAIAARRFQLAYQPIVSLADRSIHHYEALLRPDIAAGAAGGAEGPADFVTLSEAVGLTEELDLAVAEMAAAATAGLPDGVRIAFNASGLSVQSKAFRATLLAALDASPQVIPKLMMELTESAEIEDEATAAETMAALRRRGVPVCLDDFGAGAAAFRYLKAFRVDYVKVDGAFVEAALRAERDRSFVASMVDLSRAVGAKVIAERIETAEAAQMMRELGVHFGQGWLFGKAAPLPVLARAMR
jgi:EAL domain-containing protein (putative c-di-GMP-specific phosphodiesterase class I)